MTTTIDTETALTAEVIKALRNADWVRFTWDGANTTADAHKRTTRDGFPHEAEVPVPVGEARIRVYEANGDTGRTQPTRCIGVISSASVHELWRTVAVFIKPGDVLQPYWIANNNSPNLRNAGLVHDEFHLLVTRGKGTRTVRTYEFWLDDEIVFPTSSVRCITF